ncbi:unnamed protein product [Acanthoscelides obtectus]|uniref:PiggyBac transposable element-derived protein 4 n=1 Tax=Acanthoscelides obtectus TaxID=200917 RepID=A0A9P0MLI1_ACAOB|nr:unnamed protein product [Acanthoscelides obtectus]CAK1650186.1 PiggyBac transposable element-derived protein 4 [Acanthoscelides obtectus]
MFSLDPLNYHPIFPATMTGRRFEQILRCLNCADDENKEDNLYKVSSLVKSIIQSNQNMFSPPEALSLDESLLLFRGRLRFRVYIKNKKSKYGIKFYELCSNDGYVLNIEIYKGKSNREDVSGSSKRNSLVLRLLEPFLDKGHHIYMDNFYNSVQLSEILLQRKTHSTGTLRSNRKGNPKEVTGAKLKSGQHIWRRKGNVYVSKWRDKRDILSITTGYKPELVETANRYGHKKTKPLMVSCYNDNMSGIDRADQIISYHSCPRKTIRWHKKVIFHLLDIAVWNSHYLHNHNQKDNKTFKEFRNDLIKSLLGISPDQRDGREFVSLMKKTKSIPSKKSRENLGHVLEAIPVPENKKGKKQIYKRCKQCYLEQRRKDTAWQCRDCIGKPSLCVGDCFQVWHKA